MTKLEQNISSLENVTLNRLLFINKTIRENRDKKNDFNLKELKEKRKQTDQLLSKIKKIGTNEVRYTQLKQEYMTS